MAAVVLCKSFCVTIRNQNITIWVRYWENKEQLVATHQVKVILHFICDYLSVDLGEAKIVKAVLVELLQRNPLHPTLGCKIGKHGG